MVDCWTLACVFACGELERNTPRISLMIWLPKLAIWSPKMVINAPKVGISPSWALDIQMYYCGILWDTSRNDGSAFRCDPLPQGAFLGWSLAPYGYGFESDCRLLLKDLPYGGFYDLLWFTYIYYGSPLTSISISGFLSVFLKMWVHGSVIKLSGQTIMKSDPSLMQKRN